MIFRFPAFTWRKQVQSFPLLLRTFIESQIFRKIEQLLNEAEYDVKNYADREGACLIAG